MNKLTILGLILCIVSSGCGQQKMVTAKPFPTEAITPTAEPFSVEEIDEFIIENGILEEYNGSGSIVTIPDTVSTIKWEVFLNNKNIKKIILPKSVIEIQSWAFEGCSNLQEISIPTSVTSIGLDVFKGTPWLETQIKLNDLVIVGDGILISCATDIKEAEIPDNVKKIVDYAFQDCRNLNTVTIPDGVTSIGTEAFIDCINLKNITIPDTVKCIGTGAFDNTKWLANYKSEMVIIGDGILYKYQGNKKEVMLPSSVKSIESNAFYDNEILTTVTGGENVTDIGPYAFYYCDSLESFSFSNQLETIGACAFEGCNIKTVVLPKSIRSIDYRAFQVNEQLQSVSIDRAAHMEFIGGSAFALCNNLKQVMLPASLKTIESETFRGCTVLSELLIPEALTCIEYSAFLYCINLKNIVLPSSVTTIGWSAFEGAKKLETIQYDGKLTTLGGNVFKDTKWMSNYAQDFVMFEDFLLTYKGNATSVNIPDDVRYICDSAFEDNETIQEVIIPDTVMSMGDGVFIGCSKLKSVRLPSSLSTIGFWEFVDCSNLEKITIPSNVKSIEACAFDSCGLTAITIPGNVEIIEGRAFSNCTKLESIIIEEGVTTIRSNAFRNDDDFEYYAKANIKIPDSVKIIEEEAFNDSDSFAAPVITCKKDSFVYQEAMKLGLKVLVN